MPDSSFKAMALCSGVVIFIVLAGVVLIISAMHFSSKNKEEKVLNNYGTVMTIETCGEMHQYLFADRGICHLPNCKYCRKKPIQPSDFR